MITIKEFNIIGISTRTTNQGNQSSQDMAKLWERFLSEDVLAKIPNKASYDIYSIYTDYKSNYTEDYTVILGVPVTTLDNIPEGLVGRTFKGDHFQKITAKGEMPLAVVDAWLDIWKRDPELHRKYTYDFEVYGEKSQQGTHSEVDIFIATN